MILTFADYAKLVPSIQANCNLIAINRRSMISRPSVQMPATIDEMDEFASKLAS